MKIMAATLAVVVGSGAWAKQIPMDSAAPVVTVCMDMFADAVVARAQGEASTMFAEIPIAIAWRSGRPCQAFDAIHIHLSSRVPAGVPAGVLALAHPYQGIYIELFYDRIVNMAGPSILPHLLAHVLVHEITHILQGLARHSETGIMKANWNEEDILHMGLHPLRFAPEDVELVQLALKSRTRRLQAMAVTPKTNESR